MQSGKIVGAERITAVGKKQGARDDHQQSGRPNKAGTDIPKASPPQNFGRRRSDRCFHKVEPAGRKLKSPAHEDRD
jgi:hypothetical protein